MQFIYKAFDRIILELIEREGLLSPKALRIAFQSQRERSISLFYAFQLAGGNYLSLLKAMAVYFHYSWSDETKESALWENYPSSWLKDGLLVYAAAEDIHVYCYDPFLFTRKYSQTLYKGKKLIPCLTDIYRLGDLLSNFRESSTHSVHQNLRMEEDGFLGADYWLSRATTEHYSDLFIEAQHWNYRVRARKDTCLLNLSTMDLNEAESWIRKIQIRSGMDAISSCGSQDGSLLYQYGKEDILVRVSSVVSSYGVDLSLRFFYEGQGLLDLYETGLDGELCQLWEEELSLQAGCVLIGGSTGSGKTTTAYALLNQLDPRQSRIISIEDPIERVVPAWVQIPVAFNASFMEILKSTLRHDPDVLFIGEIRDLETANVSINAGLSGHLVISTMHISGVIDVIHRLQGWQLDRATIAEALIWVLAQRLYRVESEKAHTRAVKAQFESLVFDRSLKECFFDNQNPQIWESYIRTWQ